MNLVPTTLTSAITRDFSLYSTLCALCLCGIHSSSKSFTIRSYKESARNPFRIRSRASGRDASPERPSRVEGSQCGSNPSKICRYVKSACKSFIICSSKTKDLKSFRFCSYKKTYTYSPCLGPIHLRFFSVPSVTLWRFPSCFGAFCERPLSYVRLVFRQSQEFAYEAV